MESAEPAAAEFEAAGAAATDVVDKLLAGVHDAVEEFALGGVGVYGAERLGSDDAVDAYAEQALGDAYAGRAGRPYPVNEQHGQRLVVYVIGLPAIPVEGAQDVPPFGLGDLAEPLGGGTWIAAAAAIVFVGGEGDALHGVSARIVGVVGVTAFKAPNEGAHLCDVCHF